MIILYGFGEKFGLPEASPYVTKTEVQLKMAGLSYVKQFGQIQDSPKGQLPYIETEGQRIGDSTFIRAYLERTLGLDFDEDLDPRQRAEAWAIERMCENQLAWTGVHARWLMPDNFAKGPAHFFDHAPDAVREGLRQDAVAQVRQNVRATGVGRHSEPEIAALAEKSLAALSVILADKPYLMGQRPCGADATVFGILAFILTPFFDSEIRGRAERFPNLVAYVDRLMAQFYPDFAWASASERETVAA